VSASLTFQARPGIQHRIVLHVQQRDRRRRADRRGNLTVTVVDRRRILRLRETLDAQISRTFQRADAQSNRLSRIFNLANFSTVLTLNETIGTTYFAPGSVVQGRRFQLGGRVDW